MFTLSKSYRQWSDIGLIALAISIGATIGLALLDGVVKGPIATAQIASYTEHGRATLTMFSI